MPEGYCKVNPGRIRAKRRAISRAIEKTVLEDVKLAAKECMAEVPMQFIRSRDHTGSLASSFYAKGPGYSDYDDAKERMVSNFMTNDTEARALERVADEVQLGPRQFAFGSSSRVMAFWEFGHNNKITGSFEKNPVLRPKREEVRARLPARLRAALNSIK